MATTTTMSEKRDPKQAGWSYGSLNACWDKQHNIGYPWHDQRIPALKNAPDACLRCGELAPKRED